MSSGAEEKKHEENTPDSCGWDTYVLCLALCSPASFYPIMQAYRKGKIDDTSLIAITLVLVLAHIPAVYSQYSLKEEDKKTIKFIAEDNTTVELHWIERCALIAFSLIDAGIWVFIYHEMLKAGIPQELALTLVTVRVIVDFFYSQPPIPIFPNSPLPRRYIAVKEMLLLSLCQNNNNATTNQPTEDNGTNQLWPSHTTFLVMMASFFFSGLVYPTTMYKFDRDLTWVGYPMGIILGLYNMLFYARAMKCVLYPQDGNPPMIHGAFCKSLIKTAYAFLNYIVWFGFVCFVIPLNVRFWL